VHDLLVIRHDRRPVEALSEGVPYEGSWSSVMSADPSVYVY